MKKVIIESPFAGEVEENIRYARMAMKDCLLRGEAPLASHLLYTQEGILDDDIPEERTLGIEAGLLWGEEAELTVVYTDRGMSKGMELGVERAKKAGRPVEYRSLPEYLKEQELELEQEEKIKKIAKLWITSYEQSIKEREENQKD